MRAVHYTTIERDGGFVVQEKTTGGYLFEISPEGAPVIKVFATRQEALEGIWEQHRRDEAAARRKRENV